MDDAELFKFIPFTNGDLIFFISNISSPSLGLGSMSDEGLEVGLWKQKKKKKNYEEKILKLHVWCEPQSTHFETQQIILEYLPKNAKIWILIETLTQRS